MDLRVPGQRSTESKSWKKQKMSWKKSDFASCSTIPSDREGEGNLTTFVCILTPSRPIHLSLYDVIIIYRQNIILCKFNYLEALTDLSRHLIFSIISELCEAVGSTYHRITFYSSCGADYQMTGSIHWPLHSQPSSVSSTSCFLPCRTTLTLTPNTSICIYCLQSKWDSILMKWNLCDVPT